MTYITAAEDIRVNHLTMRKISLTHIWGKMITGTRSLAGYETEPDNVTDYAEPVMIKDATAQTTITALDSTHIARAMM